MAGRNPHPKPIAAIPRTRPPGRNQVRMAPLAIEYDLDALEQLVTGVVTQMNAPPKPGTSIVMILNMPGEYNVAGSPAVNGGAFTVTWNPEGPNQFLLGPISGPSAVPHFRVQDNADLPPRSRIQILATPFGGTVQPDASTSSQFKLVATSNFTLLPPTGMLDGQKITIRITQDGTGGRVMTLDPAYRYSTYLTSTFVALTAAPNATDYFGVEWNADAGKYDILSFVPGVI